MDRLFSYLHNGEPIICDISTPLDDALGAVEIGQEHWGFLQEIRQNRFDPLPRLVYADWLEEQGDPRCEFIRRAVVCEVREGLQSVYEAALYPTAEPGPAWVKLVADLAEHALWVVPPGGIRFQLRRNFRRLRSMRGDGIRENIQSIQAVVDKHCWSRRVNPEEDCVAQGVQAALRVACLYDDCANLTHAKFAAHHAVRASDLCGEVEKWPGFSFVARESNCLDLEINWQLIRLYEFVYWGQAIYLLP